MSGTRCHSYAKGEAKIFENAVVCDGLFELRVRRGLAKENVAFHRVSWTGRTHARPLTRSVVVGVRRPRPVMPVHCLHYHLHTYYTSCLLAAAAAVTSRAQGEPVSPPLLPPPHTLRALPLAGRGKRSVRSQPARPKRPRSPSKESLHKQSVRSRRRCKSHGTQANAAAVALALLNNTVPAAQSFFLDRCVARCRAVFCARWRTVRPADLYRTAPSTAATKGVSLLTVCPSLVRGKLDRFFCSVSASSLPAALRPATPSRVFCGPPPGGSLVVSHS
ncbi:hypothetical protein MRX96_018919 [Rhipicephalus microplus]